MRILIGTANIADSITAMAKGFRDIGHEVTTAAFSQNQYYPGRNFDIELCYEAPPAPDGKLTSKSYNDIQKCIQEHDMFVFMGASSLYGRFQELSRLHRANKKIVVFCMGSEIRHSSVAEPFWNAYGYEFPSAHYPPSPLSSRRVHPSQLSMYKNTFENKVYNTRMAEKYATAIFSDIPTSLLGLRPIYAAPFPFVHEECFFKIPHRTIPHIVHAPTARAIKRTDIIIASLKKLHAQGVAFTFELIENRPNSEVLEALGKADILIDQIGSAGGCGRLSLEGVASGCAVVGCNNISVPYPPRCPIIKGVAAELTQQLKILCENKELRVSLAAKGRQWISQGLTSPRTIAQRMVDACEGSIQPDYYPTAFIETCSAQQEEDIPKYLKKMSLEILQEYGCHPEASLARLIEQDFLPQGCTEALLSVPRWDINHIHEAAPWTWCSNHIDTHENTHTLEYHLQNLA